jgi:hypothetical protein
MCAPREKGIECKALTSCAFTIDIGTNVLATKVVVGLLKPLGCQSGMPSRIPGDGTTRRRYSDNSSTWFEQLRSGIGQADPASRLAVIRVASMRLRDSRHVVMPSIAPELIG